MKVVVINGSAGVGKDTFIELCSKYLDSVSISSVDEVKRIAREIGWDGIKDDKSRKFLSDLKRLLVDFNDSPFKYMKRQLEDVNSSHLSRGIMFLCIREPLEIERAKKEFGAVTLLIRADSRITEVPNNSSDKYVSDYMPYDFIIHNEGTIDDLNYEAEWFCREIYRNNSKMGEYYADTSRK